MRIKLNRIKEVFDQKGIKKIPLIDSENNYIVINSYIENKILAYIKDSFLIATV